MSSANRYVRKEWLNISVGNDACAMRVASFARSVSGTPMPAIDFIGTSVLDGSGEAMAAFASATSGVNAAAAVKRNLDRSMRRHSVRLHDRHAAWHRLVVLVLGEHNGRHADEKRTADALREHSCGRLDPALTD